MEQDELNIASNNTFTIFSGELAATVDRENIDHQNAKHDAGKPRLSLVSPYLIEAVGRVRTFGCEKYGDPENWKEVEPERYKDALIRHLCAYLKDPESVDEESGLNHLEHVACNVNFLLEMQQTELEDE